VEYVFQKVDGMVSALEGRFWKNHAVDIRTKAIAWKSIFRPVLEYGSEVWWPGQADMERLRKRVWKWALGCLVTTVNEVVLG
jgi:hypothetical protein